MRRHLAALVSLGVVATVVGMGMVALATPVNGLSISLGPAWAGTTSTSAYNWAGYAATASTGQVTSVSGAWVEPAVKCGSSTSLAAFWVGIDGYSSSTVEQDGTLAQCYHGTASYYSWWETYPANAVQTFATVSAGDHFTASVTYSSSTGKFTMSIKDTTTGTSWSKTSSNSGAKENSAECIAEAPAGASTASGIYPLANFGKVSFSSCQATIAGSSGGIGTFGTVYEITMVNYPGGTRDLAVPSSLTGNSAFTVTWKAAK
jgi:hypothetical protein